MNKEEIIKLISDIFNELDPYINGLDADELGEIYKKYLSKIEK